MLDFNNPRESIRLNNNRVIFKVRSSIEVLTTPGSGLGQTNAHNYLVQEWIDIFYLKLVELNQYRNLVHYNCL